jgi:membrane protein DedA with SNARE-associated domain
VEASVLQDFVSYLFNNVGYGGILIATIIESCLIPLPSELVIPLAGAATASGMAATLSIHHTFNLLIVILVGSAGEVIGSCIAYFIGATGGRELLLKYGRYVLISRHDAERADAFFAHRGDITIFIGRLLPVVRAYVSLPAGIAHMNFARFVSFTAAGSLLWCTILALIGRKLGEHWTDVGNWIHRFDVLIIIAVVVLAFLYVRRHLRLSRSTSTS